MVKAGGDNLKLVVRDENSTNGTKLNGKRLSRRWSAFPFGGIISAGESKLTLRMDT